MRSSLRGLVLALTALALTGAPAAAQSDILLQLRSGSPAGDRFRVDSAGGFVALGELGYGIIPASGEGDRLMWYPFKSAFRAGGTDVDAWNDTNVGFYSWAGGYATRATGIYSFAMGNATRASGQASTALGSGTNATGTGSTAIGVNSTADANYSTAIGYRASTNGMTGAFVISDQSTTDSTEAGAANQFTGRFAGGWRLFTNATLTTGVTLAAGGSSWNVVSDRDRKEEFLPLEGEEVLARLESVPVTSWRYIDEANPATRHVGPMAQDWNAAFGLSDDPLTINMSDFDGVNLAAIQALVARTDRLQDDVEARDARIAQLETEVARVAAQNAELEARLSRIERALAAE